MDFECHGSEAPQWAEQAQKEKEVKEELRNDVVYPVDVPYSVNTERTGILVKRDIDGFIGKIFDESVSSFQPNDFKKTKLI